MTSFVSFATIALIIMQIIININASAYELVVNLQGRLPTYIALIILPLFFVQKGKLIRNKLLYANTVFLIYFLLQVERSEIGIVINQILPLYGIVTWYLLGISFGLSIQVIRKNIRLLSKREKKVLAWFPVLCLISLLYLLSEYGDSPYRISSYQFPAMNAIVLMAISTLWFSSFIDLNGQYDNKITLIPINVFLVLGTILSIYIMFMNSTAIAAVWIMFILLILWHFGVIGKSVTSVFVYTCTIFLVAYFLLEYGLVDNISEQTRFKQLVDSSIFQLSSVATRLELLPLFESQFSVNPILGSMQAEIDAGYQEGSYIHSLILSSLTHTGVVGFAILLGAILTTIFSKDSGISYVCDKYVYILIFLCASLFAFFTWIPFWFMSGYMTVNR